MRSLLHPKSARRKWDAMRYPSVLAAALLAGCGPSYSPDTYSSGAVQQASKVEQGTVVGVRKVAVQVSGTTGAVAGAAAGGALGSQAGTGVTSTLSTIGGGLVGGLVGAGVERATGDTFAFEYIVRKPNNELVSVTQKDLQPLPLGQKVLVIAGPQARIVPDYTTPADDPAKPALIVLPPAVTVETLPPPAPPPPAEHP